MSEEFLLNLISNNLFPIAIAVYVLVRLENTLKENSKAINGLAEEIKKRN